MQVYLYNILILLVCNSYMEVMYTVWPENLVEIKFGGLVDLESTTNLNSAELFELNCAHSKYGLGTSPTF